MRIIRFRVFSFAPDRQLLRSRAGIRTWAVGPWAGQPGSTSGDARQPWYRGIVHCISTGSTLRSSLPSVRSPSSATRILICAEKDELAPQSRLRGADFWSGLWFVV